MKSVDRIHERRDRYLITDSKGDMSALKGLRISASGQPDILLRKLLVAGGLDFGRDRVQVVPAPRPPEGLDNLARVGIQALTEGRADGFWGNAMRAELAIRRGLATMVPDPRPTDYESGRFANRAAPGRSKHRETEDQP